MTSSNAAALRNLAAFLLVVAPAIQALFLWRPGLLLITRGNFSGLVAVDAVTSLALATIPVIVAVAIVSPGNRFTGTASPGSFMGVQVILIFEAGILGLVAVVLASTVTGIPDDPVPATTAAGVNLAYSVMIIPPLLTALMLHAAKALPGSRAAARQRLAYWAIFAGGELIIVALLLSGGTLIPSA